MLERVTKKSGRPFKSGNKENTVKSITTNPYTNNIAFMFDEDDSVVDCRVCIVSANNIDVVKSKNRYVTIHNKIGEMYDLVDFVDYNVYVVDDVRDMHGEWKQQIEMACGYATNWSIKVKGTKTANLLDNGSDITIDLNDTSITLDYSDFTKLYVLLLYYFEESGLDVDNLKIQFSK